MNSNNTNHSSDSILLLQQMVSGGVAGSTAKTATAPLSRITILYQVGFRTAEVVPIEDLKSNRIQSVSLVDSNKAMHAALPVRNTSSSASAVGISQSHQSATALKLQMQSFLQSMPDHQRRFHNHIQFRNIRELSLLQAFQTVFRNEGAASFWKGNLTSVLHRFPYSGK